MDRDLKIAIVIAIVVFLAAIIFLGFKGRNNPNLSPELDDFDDERTYVEYLPGENEGPRLTPLVIYGKAGGFTVNLTLVIALILLILIIVYRVRYHSRNELIWGQRVERGSFYKAY